VSFCIHLQSNKADSLSQSLITRGIPKQGALRSEESCALPTFGVVWKCTCQQPLLPGLRARKGNPKMKAIVNEDWVRITYTKPENEMTTQEKAECELAETAINQALERFHEKTSVGLIGIEAYPGLR